MSLQALQQGDIDADHYTLGCYLAQRADHRSGYRAYEESRRRVTKSLPTPIYAVASRKGGENGSTKPNER